MSLSPRLQQQQQQPQYINRPLPRIICLRQHQLPTEVGLPPVSKTIYRPHRPMWADGILLGLLAALLAYYY